MTNESEWRSFWRWLSDSTYRSDNELVHPLIGAWRAIWFIPVIVLFLLLLLCIFIMAGPNWIKQIYRQLPT